MIPIFEQQIQQTHLVEIARAQAPITFWSTVVTGSIYKLLCPSVNHMEIPWASLLDGLTQIYINIIQSKQILLK